MPEFVEESVMGTQSKALEKCSKTRSICGVCSGGSPVMNCLHKLRLTRKSKSEPILVRENNVVGADVFPHVAKDNMLHHLAQNTS